jgi:hypothetical protein
MHSAGTTDTENVNRFWSMLASAKMTALYNATEVVEARMKFVSTKILELTQEPELAACKTKMNEFCVAFNTMWKQEGRPLGSDEGDRLYQEMCQLLLIVKSPTHSEEPERMKERLCAALAASDSVVYKALRGFPRGREMLKAAESAVIALEGHAKSRALIMEEANNFSEGSAPGEETIPKLACPSLWCRQCPYQRFDPSRRFIGFVLQQSDCHC